MPDTVQNLFDNLDTKHPDWIEWEDEWVRYRDVLGDVLVDKETYLPQNKMEPDFQYKFRVDLSQFIPESGLAVDRLLGALFTEKPKRDFKTSEADLRVFIDKSTRRGDSWNATIEQIAFVLMGYGTTRILINVPPAQIDVNEKDLSRKEEQDLNVRPWLTSYSPLSVIDWEHDEDRVLKLVRIKEERTVKGTGKAGQKSHVVETRFIEYDAEEVRWWVFREAEKSGDKVQLIDSQVKLHNLGVVPMVVEEIREIKNFVGHSFIRYSSRADLRKFQAESDQGYDTYMHAHPFLVVWTEDELKELGVGTSTFMKLNPGNAGVGREDASYVETPSSAFEALQQVIDESRTQIFRQAQVDPMGIVASGNQGGGTFQASGVSRAWSFGTSEARILSRIADRLEQIEKQVFEVVLRWQAGEKQAAPDAVLFKGEINYPETFDMASTAQLLEERGQIAAMVNSPTLIRVIDKRIAASKVGDTTAEELDTIQGEIEDNPLLGTLSGREQDPFGFPDLETPDDDESSKNGKKESKKEEPKPKKKPVGGRV